MSFRIEPLTGDRAGQYRQLADQATALVAGESDRIANAANLAALVFHSLSEVNWVGFYLFDGNELVVGPFQGKPACVRIALGKGVCGIAAATRRTQIVPDVHTFPGHIACDADSRSEIVVPLVHGDELVGVFDLDSPRAARFDETDRRGLERISEIFVHSLSPP
ncbi:GAF domain-containing protein [Nocardia brevicatena]|uniref:GAF domain-containing protein n=1 Tax=Nocardia brevicatena TaxID=37327 RepID=UPI0002DFBDF5|nr:GAF domain-containing protein [Nocardia brevicatena]